MERKIIYSLTEEDHLNYQLFTASQSAQVKKTRNRNRLLVSGILLALGLIVFAVFNQIKTALVYAVGAAFTYFVYPVYQRYLYKKNYQKFIRETYQKNIGKSAELTFLDKKLILKNSEVNSEINYSLIEKISEVPETFYLKLNSGQSVIVPKRFVGNIDEFRNFCKELASKLNIKFEELPDWKWK